MRLSVMVVMFLAALMVATPVAAQPSGRVVEGKEVTWRHREGDQITLYIEQHPTSQSANQALRGYTKTSVEALFPRGTYVMDRIDFSTDMRRNMGVTAGRMFLISNARLDAFLFVMQKDTDLYLVTYAGNSLDTDELVAFLYYAVKDGYRVNPPVGFRKG